MQNWFRSYQALACRVVIASPPDEIGRRSNLGFDMLRFAKYRLAFSEIPNPESIGTRNDKSSNFIFLLHLLSFELIWYLYLL